jgi:hypothetical protein
VLIAEIADAMEMRADAADLALTITGTPRCRRPPAWRPGPFEGTITDSYLPEKK